MTTKEVDAVVTLISSQTGVDAAYHHSKLSLDLRREQLEKWRSEASSWIVSTSGLGQGVDYPHVRHVIHYGLAHSVLDFAQETGRALTYCENAGKARYST
jgi:superfamily II DNA helicase RecQ